MSRWRIAVVVILIAVPAIVLLSLGSYFLWQTGYGFIVWWPMFACASLGYFLAWYWLRKRRLISSVDFSTPPMHWTERDKEAWKLVELRGKQLADQEVMQFYDLTYYSNLAQEMARELARFYRPDAKDPIGALTVPEILAVVELASHDLAEMVNRNVPGSHMMTINDWRWTRDVAEKATTWYRHASNVIWLASAVFAPVETAMRWAATQAGTATPMQKFQQNLISWFHAAFVHRLGNYLIELYSGRLKVGASRYRELQEGKSAGDGKQVELVTLTVIGQTKTGKSSFINAVLGEQRAKTDVVPATGGVSRYELKLQGGPTRLVLLDTVGYAHTGAREDQVAQTQQAAEKSDVIVLVVHSRNPARDADLKMLEQLRAWFGSRPDVKMPPILTVMTHIDLLTPAMEWSPPYNWLSPKRTKEEQIQQAATAVRDQLGEHVGVVIPVCTAAGKVYGIEEWFLPSLLELLGEARAVAMLRCLKSEADAAKVRKVVEQALTAGTQLLEIWARSQQPRPAHAQGANAAAQGANAPRSGG